MIDALFSGPWGPLLIFGLRIVDVSMSMLRTLLAMRGSRTIPPLIGLFESLIWVFAVGSAIRNLDSPLHVLGYASGFAAGNSVGLWLEEKIAVGLATVQIFSRRAGEELADAIRSLGFGVTEFTGRGREGPVQLVHTVAKRRQVNRILAEVERRDPGAFIAVGEPRTVRRGWMYPGRPR